ncbi:MAG: barstar family protein [Gordonia sp. (in: high G+C Gram-positive bacteria)]
MTLDLSTFLRATLIGGPAVALTDEPVAIGLDVEHGVVVRRLAGGSMRTLDDVYAAYAHAWDFPDHFGWNKDAFADCLTDFDGRFRTATGAPGGGFLTIVDDAELLLADASDTDFDWFAQIQADVRDDYRAENAHHADRPVALEFALALQTDAENLAAVRRRWTEAGAPPAELDGR